MLQRSSIIRQGIYRRGSKGYNWLSKYYKDQSAKEELAKRREASPILPAVAGHTRPRAYLDIALGKDPLGRLEIELADDLLPKTSENFLKLCSGQASNASLKYEGTPVHRIMKNQYIQLGDVERKDGSGNHSAFETRYFEDEGFFIGHIKAGVVSMANAGSHRNASQFFITLKACPHLDGRNVAFGAVTKGLDIIEKVSKQFMVKGKPVTPITITGAGVIKG